MAVATPVPSHHPPLDPGKMDWIPVQSRRWRHEGRSHLAGGGRGPPPVNRSIRPTQKSRNLSANQDVSKAQIKFPTKSDAKFTSWSQIVTGSLQPCRSKMEFFESESTAPVSISIDDRASAIAQWKYSLVLYAVGNHPYFVRLKELLRDIWKPNGEFDLYACEFGFFVAKMESEAECDRILESGPWMVDGKLLIARRWTDSLTLDKDLLASVPVWIRFPLLPLSVWNTRSISKIASKVGRPIKMDEFTANCSRISFARVLVDISYKRDYVERIAVQLEGGTSFNQDVIYELIPPSCKSCKVFGHSDLNCPFDMKLQWVVKASMVDSIVESMTSKLPADSRVGRPLCINEGIPSNTTHDVLVSGTGLAEATSMVESLVPPSFVSALADVTILVELSSPSVETTPTPFGTGKTLAIIIEEEFKKSVSKSIHASTSKLVEVNVASLSDVTSYLQAFIQGNMSNELVPQSVNHIPVDKVQRASSSTSFVEIVKSGKKANATPIPLININWHNEYQKEVLALNHSLACDSEHRNQSDESSEYNFQLFDDEYNYTIDNQAWLNRMGRKAERKKHKKLSTEKYNQASNMGYNRRLRSHDK